MNNNKKSQRTLNLVNQIFGLYFWDKNTLNPIANLAQRLNKHQMELMLETLRNDILTLADIQCLSTARRKLLFSQSGVMALKLELITLDQCQSLPTKKLTILLGQRGLSLLSTGLINSQQIKRLSPEHLKLLTSDFGIQALQSEWITLDDKDLLSSKQLKQLCTQNGVIAIQQGLISPANIKQLTPHQLLILLSDAGLATLKNKLITVDRAKTMSADWLNAIIHHKLTIQDILLKKLSHYVASQGNQPLADLLEKEGFCFGVSICHSVMQLTDKLPWWESALSTILNWDRSKHSLSTKLFLLGADKQQSLGEIFERVANYIVFNQTNSKVLPNLNQANLLKPNGNFEALDSNKIVKVQDKKNIIGKFSLSDLILLLDSAVFKNKACLVSSSKHACALNYDNKSNTWFFYDPNYKNGKEKAFTSTTKLAKEMIARLGKCLNIRVISFDEWIDNQLDITYLRILKNSPSQFIDAETLKMLARHRLGILKVLLNKVRKNDSKLIHFIHCLTEKAEDGNSAFNILITNSNLPTIRDILDKLRKFKYILKERINSDTLDVAKRVLYLNKSKGLKSIALLLIPYLSVEKLEEFNDMLESGIITNVMPKNRLSEDEIDEITEVSRLYTSFNPLYDYFNLGEMTLKKKMCLQDFSRFIQHIFNPRHVAWDINTIKKRLELNTESQEINHPYISEMEYLEEVTNFSIRTRNDWFEWAENISGGWLTDIKRKPLENVAYEPVTLSSCRATFFNKELTDVLEPISRTALIAVN